MRNHRLLSRILLMTVALLLCLCGFAAGESAYSTENVKKIAVSEKPARTVYVVGETFSPEGGVLTVTYADKTTQEVPMTDPGVTFSSTSLTSEGSKSIKVEFGGKNTRINVTVSSSGYTVTFDGGDAGEKQATVAGGAKVERAEMTLDGYTLEGWYTDPDFREAFDFEAPVTKDTTLYAFWKKDGAEYASVTFSYDYYGVKLVEYTRPVEKGTTVEKPQDPTRAGYAFDGWYTDGTFGEAYDFTKSVEEDITILAKWQKTVSGRQEYAFEAEDTDLTGKEGVGSSGVSTERSMIQFDADGNLNPSNGRWVGFLYKNGISLEFYFASDEDVDDATISLSVSSELPGTFTFDSGNYSVLLNDVSLDYAPFTLSLAPDAGLESKIPFETFVLVEGAHIQKGANTLVLRVNNNTSIQGTTYQAVGPMVDCVKIETEAVLTWDETKGLPAKNY